MSRIDLNSLMLFYEIVNAKTISQAGERLHIPKATLSRKLRELEQQVGAILLKRGPHKLALTDIGAALYHHCEKIAVEVKEVSATASEMQSQLSGSLRISMPLGFGSAWISQAIAQFAKSYPDVSLTVHVTNRWIDVSEEPYDIAIYVGRIRNEFLPARRLADFSRGIYASPDYCARRGVPARPEDLLDHDCIVMISHLEDGLWTFTRGPASKSQTIEPRARVTDVGVAREMAIAGLGFTLLPNAMCRDEVEQGALRRVLPDWKVPPVVAVATFLEHRHMPLRIRVFLDVLKERFQPVADPT